MLVQEMEQKMCLMNIFGLGTNPLEEDSDRFYYDGVKDRRSFPIMEMEYFRWMGDPFWTRPSQSFQCTSRS